MVTDTPDHWRYEIDPMYHPDGEVPPEAIIGAQGMSASGETVGQRQMNPNYRPSMLAQLLQMNPQDSFLQYFGAYVRGELGAEEFRDVFINRSFVTVTDENGEGLLLVEARAASSAYLIYTSPAFYPEENTTEVRGSTLLEHSEGIAGFEINRSNHGALWLPVEELLP